MLCKILKFIFTLFYSFKLRDTPIVCTVKALYFAALCFAVCPMNFSSLEFSFTDFELLNCYNALPKRSRGI